MNNNLVELFKLILSLAAVVVSTVAWRTARASLERQRRPVIVFEHAQERGWSIRNVGAGPALNVVVAKKSAQAGWDRARLVPPLAAGADYTLDWLSAELDDTLACDYADFRSVCYGSLMSKLRHSAHETPQLPLGVAANAQADTKRQLRSV